MSMPDKEKASIPADGQGACLVPSNPGHGGMPQVDDMICSGLTADQGGAWEQYASMAGVSGPGQRGPWRQGLTQARHGDRRGNAGWRPGDRKSVV